MVYYNLYSDCKYLSAIDLISVGVSLSFRDLQFIRIALNTDISMSDKFVTNAINIKSYVSALIDLVHNPNELPCVDTWREFYDDVSAQKVLDKLELAGVIRRCEDNG